MLDLTAGDTRVFLFHSPGASADPGAAMQGWQTEHGEMRFVRFRPPNPHRRPSGDFAPFPNIRLDRALETLIGDYVA